MKNLKIKSIFLSLMAVAAITVLLTSCEKEIADVNNHTNDNAELVSQTSEDEDLFMKELIQSTSNKKIKQWLTMDKSNETNPEIALKLFRSFSIEESKEVNEIITKLEYHIFENYTVGELKLSSTDQSSAKQEITEALENRKIINKAAITQFKKNMWSLNETELKSLKINNTNELMSRGSCTNRKRIFNRNSTMTAMSSDFSNCKASYDVKACYQNLNDCASDCDWEFRFDGLNLNHRIVYNHLQVWDSYYVLAIAINVAIMAVHGTNLGARYQFWGGQWHTYLQFGYPDALGANIGTTISRWTLRTFLSMH